MKKKLMSMLLILVVALLSVTTIHAEDSFHPKGSNDFSIEITPTDGETGIVYKAYQILSGDVLVENDGAKLTMSNIEWGEAIKDNAGSFLTALKTDDLIKSHYQDVVTASQFADKVSGTTHPQYIASIIYGNIDTTKAISFTESEGKYVASNLAPGYYLISDETNTTGHIPSRYMVQVVGDVKIAPKSVNAPTVEKKVVDINDSDVNDLTLKNTIAAFNSNTAYATIDQLGAWGDSADHDLNDELLYRLDAQLPDNITEGDGVTAYYQKYTVKFVDSLSNGITPNVFNILETDFSAHTSVKDYYSSTNTETALNIAASAFDWYTNSNSLTLKPGSTTEYLTNKELARNDIRLFIGNQEKSNPYKEYSVVPYTLYSKLPTLSDLVAEIKAADDTKTDATATAEALNGNYLFKDNCFYLEFDLTSGNRDMIVCSENVVDIVKNSDWIRVFYKAELNANAVIGSAGNPNQVKLWYSTHQDGSGLQDTNPDKVTVFTYEVDVTKIASDTQSNLTGADFLLEKYDAVTNAWIVVDTVYTNGTLRSSFFEEDGTTYLSADKEAEHKALVATNSKFSFVGIDEGTYRLTETIVPQGYNELDTIVFALEATHESNSDDPKLTNLGVRRGTFNENTKTFNAYENVAQQTFNQQDANKDGKVEVDVVNKKGITLPSTGGIGTTIFYVGGAALIIGAMTMLVANKKTKE